MKKKGGWFSVVRKAFISSNDSKEKNEKKPQKTTSKKSWFGKEKNIETESSQPESVFAKFAEQQAEKSEPTEEENEPGKDIIPDHEPNKPAKPNEPSRPTKLENEPIKSGSMAAAAAAAFRWFLGKSKEEVAAIKVQTDFWHFLSLKRQVQRFGFFKDKEKVTGFEGACEVKSVGSKSVVETTSNKHFSYGVLVLEIVRKIENSFMKTTEIIFLDMHGDSIKNASLFSIEFMSESLRVSCVVSEVLRSIHVALLCVQHHTEDRPTMLSEVLMLVSEGALPEPKQLAFVTGESSHET